jgi:hypothetical protein
VRRRKFITLLGGAAAWPLAARAQQPDRVRRIGVLMHGSQSGAVWQQRLAAFRQGLEGLGWQEGRKSISRRCSDRTPTHGYATTRDAAMAAFAKSWRRE